VHLFLQVFTTKKKKVAPSRADHGEKNNRPTYPDVSILNMNISEFSATMSVWYNFFRGALF
jgi:hypothetical protein